MCLQEGNDCFIGQSKRMLLLPLRCGTRGSTCRNFHATSPSDLALVVPGIFIPVIEFFVDANNNCFDGVFLKHSSREELGGGESSSSPAPCLCNCYATYIKAASQEFTSLL